MFTKALFKLTVFYSLFFFILFWSFSFGLYALMEHSLEGDVALNQLANILVILNAGLLFIIPIISWFFARQTLLPITQANEQQKQFVSDASHELRTPLTIMLGEMEIALQKQRSNWYYRQILTSNKEELSRLSTLVENLLFLAREDQNKHGFQFEAVDITDVISSVMAHLNSEIKKKRLKIVLKPPEESKSVYGNASLLSQLFFNLIDNAVKYTPAKGTITISITKKGKSVEITVEDTGIGISPAIQGKIFERFYRADSSRSLKKGYGLGLSICKVIVNLHRGSLTVHSQEGKGSIFVIFLPIASVKSS